MSGSKMHGFRSRLDFVLKHNYVINRLFNFIASLFFRAMGCFIRTDRRMVFFSAHTRMYNDSPKAIYEYMINSEAFQQYKYVWALEDPYSTSIPGSPIKVKSDSLSYFYYALKSHFWITCVNIERGLHFKKKGCKYLNTWHATPVKTMGNSAAGRKDYDFSDVDLFCISGEYERAIYLRDLNIKNSSVLTSGMPRNDELYHFTESDKNAIRVKLGIPSGKKVILYAPTWRDSKDGGRTYLMNPPMDVKKWEKELGEDYVLLVRTHQYTNQLLGIQFNDFARDYCSYPVVNDLLKVTDILISDYSAIIFDYCITERPIFCFGYDYQEFASARGFYVNLDEVLPMGVHQCENKLLAAIKNIDYPDACSKTAMFKRKYMEYGGNATEMCVNSLFK